MPMDYPTMIKEGGLDALAAVYQDPTAATVLLTGIGFPASRRPAFPLGGDPRTFWANVCQQIENGILEGGFEALLAAAADDYPGHRIFSRFRRVEQPAAPAAQSAPAALARPTAQEINVMVSGWESIESLLAAAQRLAAELRMPSESVGLAFANAEGVLLTLSGWEPTLGAQFAERMRMPQNGRAVRASMGTSGFRDYLISQLYVEGPDQARFEINDIRASTPVRDVAQGIIATQYDPKMFQDRMGRGRAAVIDRLENGRRQRLEPDSTLHDAGIREGDTLHVSPESTAGGVNPFVRDDALARARAQVLAYADGHAGFGVQANALQAPTEYLFKFKAPSFAPPLDPVADPPMPIPIERHEVFLVLPADFPMKAPEAFWQTAIFHPNVHMETGKVCLGALGEHYRPGLDFGDLCQLLVDIAAYRNYALEEGYNLKAQHWAGSEAGQIAIEERGGHSYIRKALRALHDPRPLRIRRV